MVEVTRKSAAALEPDERQRLMGALNIMQDDGRMSGYTAIHASSWPHAHTGPAFLPWHRSYLRRFELDLQDAAGSDELALPYWDWTSNNLDDNGNSLIWGDDFLGGSGNVTTGPLAGWGLDRRAFDVLSSPGDNGVSDAMDDKLYRQFRPSLEGQPHGGAHGWVGGLLLDPATAGRDPTFYMLHANVDRLWARWQRDRRGEWEGQNPGQEYPQTEMADDYFWDRSAPNRTWERPNQMTGQNLNDEMWPWNGEESDLDGVSFKPWNQPGGKEAVRPLDMLDHHTLEYRYDDEPGAPGAAIS